MDTVLGDLMGRSKALSQREIWFFVFSDMKFKTKVLDFIRIDQLFEQGVNEDDQVIGRYSIVTETVYNPEKVANTPYTCLLYTSPSPRDRQKSRMPSSA